MAVPIPGGLCLSSCRRAAGACAVPCRASAASSAHAINGATKQFNFMSDTGRSLLLFDPTPRCSRRASVERFPTRIHVVPTSQTGDSPPPVQDQAVKLLVFDWDGTVVDSIAHITDSWTRAFEDWVAARQEERLQAGLSPCFVPPAEEVKKCIGLSVDATILHHIKDPTDEDIDAVREAYRKYFRAGADNTQYFPGAQDGLQRLKDEGYHLAVATGKSRRGLDREFGILEGSRWFTVTRTAECTQSKPHPQMLHEIMEEFGVLPGNTVMIGDSVVDMTMAQRAGVSSIAVGYGSEPKDALEAQAPLTCADNWPALVSYILQKLPPE